MGRWLWWAAAVGAVAAGIALALLRAPHSITIPVDPDAWGAAPAASQVPFPAPPLRAGDPPPGAGDTPPGIDAAAWARLRQELAGQPAELQRLAGYYTFNDRIARWRAGGPDRARLSAEIDATLDERLAQRELSAGEARRIKAAVLQDLLPDEAARAAALAAWEAAQRSAPSPDARQAAAQDARFQQRQAAVLAAWRAQPEAQRDPKALERELEALRRASYPAVSR